MAMEVEARIAAGFAEALRADLTRSAYLERYLATHIGSSGLWSELDQKVLDLVDPDTVRMEAFRKAYGRTVLPPAVLVTMLVADKLATIDPASRGLVRALAAHRLRITGAGVSDPALWWCRLSPVVPHITLSGHTGWVVGVVFGQVEGRTVLAPAGDDATER